jgi:hypothetical protein
MTFHFSCCFQSFPLKVPLEFPSSVGSLPARCDCDSDAFLALPRFTHGVLRRDAGKLPEDHPQWPGSLVTGNSCQPMVFIIY